MREEIMRQAHDMSQENPVPPEVKPVDLDLWKKALLVLDLDERCGDPGHHSEGEEA
jgi:hypothetical protein